MRGTRKGGFLKKAPLDPAKTFPKKEIGSANRGFERTKPLSADLYFCFKKAFEDSKGTFLEKFLWQGSGQRPVLSSPLRILRVPYCAASTIAVNFSGTSEAPPIKPPSTFGLASSSAAFLSFIEPPYWIVRASAASSP